MKQFDEHTKEKANGRYRLLIVDGHNSHYTRGFLEHARTHMILVICYPAHATHILQGLDVVVFAIVKRCLTEERDLYEFRTGEKISKKNFLEIYGNAHLKALTPRTIKSAFRATGVWPFNADIIQPDAMAPSKETSCESYLPVAPATPVRVVVELLQKMSLGSENHENEEDEDAGSDIEGASDLDEDESGEGDASEQLSRGNPSGVEGEEADVPTGNSSAGDNRKDDSDAAVREAIRKLSEGDLSALVSTGKITSGTELSHNTNLPIARMVIPDILSITPKTLHERILLAALRESTARENFLQKRL